MMERTLSTERFFDGLKKKQLKTAFALYFMNGSKGVPEIEKWYIDYNRPDMPIVAKWRPSGTVSIMYSTAEAYKLALGEYKNLKEDARIDTASWDAEHSEALRQLRDAEIQAEKRFWTSYLSAMEFIQIDRRF